MQLAEEDKGSLDIVIRGDVARIVLKNALENVPDSLQLRLRLLEVLEEAYLPGVEVLAGDVFEDLEVRLIIICCLSPRILWQKGAFLE